MTGSADHPESHDREMMVEGECQPDPHPPHDGKAGCIHG
jgi:hypothetical protein